MLPKFFTLLATAVSAVAAGPLAARDVINHDAVVGFPQSVPNSNAGRNMLRFKPWLKVFSGCVPFPAVDQWGNTGGGLKTSGSHSSGCSKNVGQVYARAGTQAGRGAIMYSWYMPKDSPSPGMGHRHDWENVIIWLDDVNSANARIIGASASGHGGYDTRDSIARDGDRALIRYFSNWPLNHQMGFTGERGGEQPLVSWDTMTQAARNALEWTDFGAAGVPFKDGSFQNNLAKVFQ
ncbi:elicitor [Pyricularia oryzae 70-15]|uniref:Elicitor n=4 Tax=Pyricularia oryzae TaxID=318829 RepID=G4NA85_PYRO7|nr:elicitor [Pyricularia oryzae 70-15]ELQ36874.1 25 kDa protein elicitor [Pyricularia oryzae Y34]KAI7915216.1 elicitor [Pyricularia oryzae]EHA49635.1 elicitor [Pyricularia oryzae 70-15]KAI7917644.1 elicitor [Pyricularia oryzae]QBZ60161.1 hypothetical protein PoMZ_07099 [Pyricularia oryzae]